MPKNIKLQDGKLNITSETGPVGLNSKKELHITSPNDIKLLATGTIDTDVSNGQIELGALSSPEDTALTITSGNSSTTDGSDLVLRGGVSSVGENGTIIIDGDLAVTGKTLFLGQTTTLHLIEFFAPSIVTSGSSPNITLDSKGIVRSLLIESTGHVGFAETPPVDGSTTYLIQRIRNGVTVQIGSVLFDTSSNFASSISITNPSLQLNDIVILSNPALPDTGINNVTITLRTNIV
jgi:hypothetical protein